MLVLDEPRMFRPASMSSSPFDPGQVVALSDHAVQIELAHVYRCSSRGMSARGLNSPNRLPCSHF